MLNYVCCLELLINKFISRLTTFLNFSNTVDTTCSIFLNNYEERIIAITSLYVKEVSKSFVLDLTDKIVKTKLSLFHGIRNCSGVS